MGADDQSQEPKIGGYRAIATPSLLNPRGRRNPPSMEHDMHLSKALPLAAALTAGLMAQSPAPAPPPVAPAPLAPPSILGFALTGSTTLGSQYIFRGLTQTDGKPTI